MIKHFSLNLTFFKYIFLQLVIVGPITKPWTPGNPGTTNRKSLINNNRRKHTQIEFDTFSSKWTDGILICMFFLLFFSLLCFLDLKLSLLIPIGSLGFNSIVGRTPNLTVILSVDKVVLERNCDFSSVWASCVIFIWTSSHFPFLFSVKRRKRKKNELDRNVCLASESRRPHSLFGNEPT